MTQNENGLVPCSCGVLARNIPHHKACQAAIVARALLDAQIEALEWAANLRDERDISVYEKFYTRIAQLRAEAAK